MKVTKHNLEYFMHSVEYNYVEEVLTIYTNISGYLIPFSILPYTEEVGVKGTPTITKLDSLGFSRQDIYEGHLRCKILNGYS